MKKYAALKGTMNGGSGEIERAQNEDRQIKFTGASSIKDLIAQRKYNKQYPEWDKKTKSARMYNAMLANKE